MEQDKFDMIREGARKRRAAREAQLNETIQQPELQIYESPEAVIDAIRKAK